MFDKDLFYSLCARYDVELSDKYNTVMIKEETDLKELNMPSDLRFWGANPGADPRRIKEGFF